MFATRGAQVIIGTEVLIKAFREAHPGVRRRNAELAKDVRAEIERLDPECEIVERDWFCVWSAGDGPVGEYALPATATQFAVDASIVADLFRFAYVELGRRWGVRSA